MKSWGHEGVPLAFSSFSGRIKSHLKTYHAPLLIFLPSYIIQHLTVLFNTEKHLGKQLKCVTWVQIHSPDLSTTEWLDLGTSSSILAKKCSRPSCNGWYLSGKLSRCDLCPSVLLWCHQGRRPSIEFYCNFFPAMNGWWSNRLDVVQARSSKKCRKPWLKNYEVFKLTQSLVMS